jgi:hypothetical protein
LGPDIIYSGMTVMKQRKREGEREREGEKDGGKERE